MMTKGSISYTGRCIIGVGANINPERNILRGLDILHQAHPIVQVSTFYRTKAIDRPEQPDYLNGLVGINFSGVLRQLKFDVLRRIEEMLGRERSKDAYAPRPIDLDIVLCGDLVAREPGLIVPDPDIRRRPFLIAALIELQPDVKLPDSRTALKGFAVSPEIKQLQAARTFSAAAKERYVK